MAEGDTILTATPNCERSLDTSVQANRGHRPQHRRRSRGVAPTAGAENPDLYDACLRNGRLRDGRVAR